MVKRFIYINHCRFNSNLYKIHNAGSFNETFKTIHNELKREIKNQIPNVCLHDYLKFFEKICSIWILDGNAALEKMSKNVDFSL